MKLVLTLAAIAALGLVFSTARAVEDPPDPHVQLVEVEQMTPYLESAPGTLTAGTATQSIIRKVGNSGGVVFSSSSYAQLDNHNADQSRGSFPLDVEDGDTYGISAVFVKSPTSGIVQLSIDGRPLGAPYDEYGTALAASPAVPLGTLALAEGKHILTMTVVGKNAASTDWVGGLDLLVLDSTAAPQATPTAVATAEVGAAVPATLALTLGAPPSFGPFQPGVTREYGASTTANVISTAGDAALTVADPASTATGHLVNGTFALPSALKVAGQTLPATVRTWSSPVSNEVVPVAFTQAVGANDALRTGVYAKTLTFTLSTTNP
jgi:hypothetical protein